MRQDPFFHSVRLASCNMPTLRLVPVFLLQICVLPLVLAGCAGSEEARGALDTRSYSYESNLYRVEITQRSRNGRCIRRNVLFTSFGRLYTQPHVDRVRAVDELCDANDISDFENFQIMRDPDQQDRYARSASFRTRVNQDLWDVYENALFDAGEL